MFGPSPALHDDCSTRVEHPFQEFAKFKAPKSAIRIRPYSFDRVEKPNPQCKLLVPNLLNRHRILHRSNRIRIPPYSSKAEDMKILMITSKSSEKSR